MTLFAMLAAVAKKLGQVLTLAGANAHREDDYERYLNASTDVHDLEARERAWIRKMQNRNLY